MGGVRCFPFPTGAAALEDVTRLARGMTAKAAVAGLDLGGGKAVIIGDPRTVRTPDLLDAFARVIDSLAGRYVTTTDVGMTVADLDRLRRSTAHVVGTSPAAGGSGSSAIPTAVGLFGAMQATVEHLDPGSSLGDRHVAVQGVGKVGRHLVELLVEAGCRVTVADTDPAAVEGLVADHGVAVEPVERIHAVACDIFSACALGATLNPTTIGELRCSAVVGSANNQLADDGCASLMAERGILYVPNYVVNAGGLIAVGDELFGYDEQRVSRRVAGIHDTTRAVLRDAAGAGITPLAAAAERAVQRLAGSPRSAVA